MFDPSSKSRLTRHDLDRFPTGGLFDRVGRVVCRAGCLPRKELFEAWEVARRVRRRFRGGRVVDLCAGHGLLGHLMLLLDDTSPTACLADVAFPASAERLHDALVAEWPRLAGRLSFLAASLEDVALTSDDVVVSVHACGALTDRVIAHASGAGARLAVVPCCHDLDVADTGGLSGWIEKTTAVDVTRALAQRAAGRQVWTQAIPVAITPHNRLLMSAPGRAG
jgi:hypothetical protein